MAHETILRLGRSLRMKGTQVRNARSCSDGAKRLDSGGFSAAFLAGSQRAGPKRR